MIKINAHSGIFCSLLVLTTLTLFSCKTQKVIYLRDVPDDLGKTTTVVPAEFKEPVIQVDDIMNISIQTIDPQATAALNQPTATMPGAASSSNGYLVDETGEVEIPILGMIKLAGLTTSQAKEKVRDAASKFYKNPTVQVRFANYSFTIIGDVNRSGRFTIPTEKFSVLDAVGMAGDLAITGKRQNVMLIREHEGKKDIVRLDLTSTDLLKSPYYYIKQNDVIYVEPGQVRVASNNSANIRYYTLAVSFISLAISIFLRLSK